MSHFRTSSQYSLYYQLRGPATARHRLFLVMGFGCDRHYWAPLDDLLAADTDVQLLWVDSRGFGRSTDSIHSRASTSSLARDYYDLLMAVGWLTPTRTRTRHQLHVIGWSLGGMVAQHLALLCLDQLVSLTLLCTSLGGGGGGLGWANAPPWRGWLIGLRACVSCRPDARIARIVVTRGAVMLCGCGGCGGCGGCAVVWV